MADPSVDRDETPSPEYQQALQPEEVELPELSIGDCESKADIRAKVWEYLEKNNLASFPRPVKNRIPNYKGSAAACDKVAELEAFRTAQTLKINPDKPQEQARFRTLEMGKTLLVPTPRLRKGLFNKIQPPDTKKSTYKFCSSSQGVKQYSSPLGLDMKVKVDLVVIGSVAVSTSGWRIGKGEGFADLEYGMMASVGAVSEDTLVVTSVHDCQVMDLPDDIFGRHDVTIDYICTPTRVIECSRRPKPKGIIWSLLSLEKFVQIPILKVLREQERAAGVDVTLEDASEEEIEEALIRRAEQEAELEAERAAERESGDYRGGRNRRPNRFNRRRPRGPGDDDGGVGSGGVGDSAEHADGEESPSGGDRYRGNRRRRVRNRRRNRDSEQMNSGEEGDDSRPMSSPLPNDDGRRPPRRQRRFRRGGGPTGDPRREQRYSEHGDERDMESYDDQERGGYRGYRRGGGGQPRRRYNNQRRSEGDDGGDNYNDGGPPPRRRQGPGRYGYQNRRPNRNYNNRRNRQDNDLDYDDEEYSDGGNRDQSGSPSGDRRRRDRPRRNNNLPTIYVGSLPKALRVSVFKKQVRDMDVNPLRVLWRGSNGHVFLIFETMPEMESALRKLENLSINDKEVKVAMANRTERRRQGGDDYEPRGGDDDVPTTTDDNIVDSGHPRSINSVTTEL